MTVIYSENKINGLEGIYANPKLFNGDTESCKSVITNDERIKQAYEKKGIPVFDFPQTKKLKKEDTLL